jgi:Co/Zn/Cd efflux system component
MAKVALDYREARPAAARRAMTEPNEKLTYRGKAIIRTVGAAFIAACCLMVVLGTTLWREQLQGPRFVLYWGWCFLVALAAIVVALVDLLLVHRAGRQRRRELFRKQFSLRPPDAP